MYPVDIFEVSILVLVDAALRPVEHVTPEQQETCFNPCFSGCRPATARFHVYYWGLCYSFNPCFSGCRPATYSRVCGLYTYRIVSILVLVDAALRQDALKMLSNPRNGFNPCFSGCRPATTSTTSTVVSVQQVSILVLVDAALRPHKKGKLFGYDMFQSLF